MNRNGQPRKRRQQWSVVLLDEAIFAVTDRLDGLRNTDGVLPARVVLLSQALDALRADRAKYWHRERRTARRLADRVAAQNGGAR